MNRRTSRTGSRRAVAVTAVATAVATLAAGCTSSAPPPSVARSAAASGSSPVTGSATPASAVAYSGCMRSHGVARFPDPDSGGNLPKADATRLGVSAAQLRAAQTACRALLPASGSAVDAGSVQACMESSSCPQPLVQHVLTEERAFARCMRSHGVPNWPDPTVDSQGRPVFAISTSKLGFDPYSRRVWAEGNQCAHLMPDLPGLPAAVSP